MGLSIAACCCSHTIFVSLYNILYIVVGKPQQGETERESIEKEAVNWDN